MSLKEKSNRLLVVVFDALRPDMVSEKTMPNLSRFAREGVRFTRSRSVFPTETRVNQAAFVTGCWPARHNIVGNRFVEMQACPDALFNTGNEDALREGDQRLGGALLGVPSLGEILHRHGHSLAAISAGTPGGGRLLHHRAETTGGMRLALARPDACFPTTVVDEISARIGPIPKASVPSFEWLTWTAQAWIEYVETTLRPTVSVLWFCEPDNSYHLTGIGSPENVAVLAHADRQFADVLAVARRQGVNVITCSDHGQLAVSGDALDLSQQAADAGFLVADVPAQDEQIAFALDSAGGIFVNNNNADVIQRLVRWLGEMPWCHSLSTRSGIDGSLTHADLGIDSARAPDVALCLSNDNAPGPFGIAGTSLHDASYPVGGGIHGGLNPLELSNWLAMSGPVFGRGVEHHTSVGIVDLLPTMLNILGVADTGFDGRVLHEAFAGGSEPPPEQVLRKPFSVGRLEREIALSYVDGHRYLHGVDLAE